MTYGTSNIIVGDCRDELAKMPEQHFHCCVTSPPYFGLRDYGHDGQIGLEPTPDDFVEAMVSVFGEVWRVLRDDGVLWLNLGDSYATSGGQGEQGSSDGGTGRGPRGPRPPRAAKPKDLIGIPWRVAFALQAAGWYLRDAVIWHKPAPMPGSQRDRCTSSYEFIFQLTKKPRYYFDLEAVKEVGVGLDWGNGGGKVDNSNGNTHGLNNSTLGAGQTTRTPRNVWKIAHEGFNEAHFATFPREIPTRCIKASTSEKGCCPACGAPWERIVKTTPAPDHVYTNTSKPNDGKVNGNKKGGQGQKYQNWRDANPPRTTGWQPTCDHQQTPAPCRVLDPFNGAGTTGIAANLLGRDYTGIELNPEYAEMARNRIARELRPSTAMNMNAEPKGLFA